MDPEQRYEIVFQCAISFLSLESWVLKKVVSNKIWEIHKRSTYELSSFLLSFQKR